MRNLIIVWNNNTIDKIQSLNQRTDTLLKQ